MTTGSMGSTNGGDARPRVLVAEDDRSVRESLVLALGLEGYDVDAVGDGEQALEAVLAQEPDAVLLDVMMPYLDGLTVCRRLRARGSKVPILMLTARHEVSDRVSGLDAGADDYLVKPFAIEELSARVRALGRRGRSGTDTQPGSVLTSGPIALDEASRVVTVDGVRVDLSPREFALLECLLRHRGNVLSRDQLLDHAWPYDSEVVPPIVDTYVYFLRRKLGPVGGGAIETVRGIGYRVLA